MQTPAATRLIVASACALALATGVVVAAPGANASGNPDQCVKVRFISVRGSGEAGGIPGNAARAIRTNFMPLVPAGQTPYLTGIDYPAVGLDLAEKYLTAQTLGARYTTSKSAGVRNLTRYLNAQAACKSERWIVIGFSQGAQVVLDSVSTQDGAVSAYAKAHIAGVVLLADPRFNSRESYDRGSYHDGRNGLIGARTFGDVGTLHARIRSWCDTRDPICQGTAGGYDTKMHDGTRYANAYAPDINAFLAAQLGWNIPATPGTSTWQLPMIAPGDDAPSVSRGSISLSKTTLHSGDRVHIHLRLETVSTYACTIAQDYGESHDGYPIPAFLLADGTTVTSTSAGAGGDVLYSPRRVATLVGTGSETHGIKCAVGEAMVDSYEYDGDVVVTDVDPAAAVGPVGVGAMFTTGNVNGATSGTVTAQGANFRFLP